MKRLVLLFTLIFGALPVGALAQQETPPEVQAMSGKIMREVSEGLQCQVAGIKLAKEIEMLKARLKELEDKTPAPTDVPSATSRP